jgi:hypothetical protein
VNSRKAPLSPALLAGAALVLGVLSCGEVPTLPDGIAYITSVILPSPAVAFGDTLRDSTGTVAPLRLYGIGNAGDTIRSITPVFVATTVPGKGVTITAADLVIGDSVRTVQIVGQVGTRLQTPATPLDVVWQPDSIAASTPTASLFPLPGTGELSSTVTLGTTVTSAAGGTRAGVKSIIVRYAITGIFPADASIPDTTLVLVDESNRFSGTTGRTAVDTTDASGSASRRVRAVPFGFDSVEITASANDLKGVPLKGGPIRFVVTTK